MTDTHIQNSTIPTPCKTKQFPGASHFTDSRGKVRWRYRKAGFQAGLGTDYASDEFIERYTAATHGVQLKAGEVLSQISPASRRGTFAYAVQQWYQSEGFTSLSKTTRYGYKRRADNLALNYGSRLVSAIATKDIAAFMSEKATAPTSANHDLLVIRFVLDKAKDMGLIRHNPARDVPRYLVSSGGYHTWTETEIATFYGIHLPGTMAHTCITIMLYTGASRADAAKMGRHHIYNERLRYSRHDTKDRAGVPVDIPVHPFLASCLEAVPADHKWFLQTSTGRAPAPGTVGNYMRDWCDAAGLKQCSAHGLRKACERRLGEAGLLEQPIASVMGLVNTTTPHTRIGMGVRPELADQAITRLG